jgi:Zn-dependent protease
MRFRLFGIPVEIQFGFWLISVFFAIDRLSGPHPYLIVEWTAVVLVSVLVHELGHALALLRFGVPAEITLYAMGGVTASPIRDHLARWKSIFISFAGPLAGFILGGAVLALEYAVPSLAIEPTSTSTPGEITRFMAVQDLLLVNFAWGLVNLVPVLPFDGGHILEHALGPRRQRLTALLSTIIGGLVTAAAVGLISLGFRGMWWPAMLFGFATFQSWQRHRALADDRPAAPRPKRVEPREVVPAEVEAQLRKAKGALDDDRFDEARTLAELVLSASPPREARVSALEVVAWSHLLQGRPEEAARALKSVQKDGNPDLALVGAVLMAKGESGAAREVLEKARSQGDDRKEVVGPLIQILIAQGEVARAAAIALDIIDALSDDDARHMAHVAFEHQAFGWAARLDEALFGRTGLPDDAYHGVQSRTLDGDLPGALALLKRAVAAGFSDAARVWSDNALERLRGEDLETLLPRPW